MESNEELLNFSYTEDANYDDYDVLRLVVDWGKLYFSLTVYIFFIIESMFGNLHNMSQNPPIHT